jgi:hypothetical protein
MSNINLYNKFEDECDFIFRYEDYSHNYIQQFSSKILNIELTTCIIDEIMNKLENMLKIKILLKKRIIRVQNLEKHCYVGDIIHQMEHLININNCLLMYLTNC